MKLFGESYEYYTYDKDEYGYTFHCHYYEQPFSANITVEEVDSTFVKERWERYWKKRTTDKSAVEKVLRECTMQLSLFDFLKK